LAPGSHESIPCFAWRPPGQNYHATFNLHFASELMTLMSFIRLTDERAKARLEDEEKKNGTSENEGETSNAARGAAV
jgi:hypothetical protein